MKVCGVCPHRRSLPPQTKNPGYGPAESPRATGNPKNAMFFDAPYLQNKFGDPRFFLRF